METHLANRWSHDQAFALSGLDAHGEEAGEVTGRTMHRFGVCFGTAVPVKVWVKPPPGVRLIPPKSVVMTDVIELYFIRPGEGDEEGGTAAEDGASGTFGGSSSDTADTGGEALVGPFDDQVPSEELELDLGLPPETAANKVEGLRSGTFRVVFADEHTVLMCTDDYLGTQATFHVASPALGTSQVRPGSTVLAAGGDAFSLHLERGLLRSTLTIVHSRRPGADMRSAAAEKCYDLDGKIRRRLRIASPSPCPRLVPEFLQPAYYKALSLVRCCVRPPAGRLASLWPASVRERDSFTVPEAICSILAWRFIDKQLAADMLLGLLAHVDEHGFLPMTLSPGPPADAASEPPAPPMLAFAAYHIGHQIGTRSLIEQLYEPVERALRWAGEHMAGPLERLLAWPTPLSSLEPDSPRFDNLAGAVPVDLNSLFIGDLRYLAGMAKGLNKLPEHHRFRDEADERSARLCRQLYNGAEGFFFDQQADGNLLQIKTAAALLPMYAYAVDAPVAKRLMDHATAAEEFRLKFPLATVSADARDFAPAPDRGAVNPLINYLVIRGMSRYGYKTIADNFTNVTLASLAEAYDSSGCFWPYYDPHRKRRPKELTPAAHHAADVPDYAPAAALFLSLCHEYYGERE